MNGDASERAVYHLSADPADLADLADLTDLVLLLPELGSELTSPVPSERMLGDRFLVSLNSFVA